MFKKVLDKKRRYDTNIHKAMRILDGKFQTNNKLFVMVNPNERMYIGILLSFMTTIS